MARFAYTPMLPSMQAQTGMGDSLAGWLAGWNYFGYLTGVVIISRLKNLILKDKLYRIGLVLAVLTTLLMAASSSPIIWGISRYLAGISTAAGLLLGSGLILHWLIHNNHRTELGIHFAGIGLGIAAGAILVEFTARTLSWDQQWLVLGFMGMMMLIPAWIGLPLPTSTDKATKASKKQSATPSNTWLWLLQLAYFLSGIGYVVYATFSVVIIERYPSLQGQGIWLWCVVGICAAPSAIIWDRIARRTGYVSALQLAFALKMFGLILPVLHNSFSAVVLSAILYGLTFVGIVSLVLTMVGVRYPHMPASIMARLTLSYCAAQIIGPIIAGEIAETTNSFNLPLLLSVAMMAVGLICLQAMRKA